MYPAIPIAFSSRMPTSNDVRSVTIGSGMVKLVGDRQPSSSQQRVVMLLVLALGGTQDDDCIIPDLEIAILATLARHPEQRDCRSLHGGERIETGLQRVAVSHGEG